MKSSFGDFGNEFSKQIRKNIEKDLHSVICPKHGKRVQIKWKSQLKNNMDFTLDSCCDELAEKALAKLN